MGHLKYFSIREHWYNLKIGLKNLWTFFPVIWEWRRWDFSYNMELLQKGLELYLEEDENDGFQEVNETRIPKEEDMRKVIDHLDDLNNDNFILLAEAELGYEATSYGFEFEPAEGHEGLFSMVELRTKEEQDADEAIFALSNKLEQEAWNEIWDTIKKGGQGWWT